MSTIIIEGPDNSGKTMLAYALIGWMGPDKCHYVKSPAGESKEWDESWNEWNAQHIEMSSVSGKTYIMDRTPEISELVYGPVIRGFTRLRNPLSSLQRLNHPDTLIIMTSTNKRYDRSHTDYLGNVILDKHISIAATYNLINLLMKYDGFQLGLWDYEGSHMRHIVHRINSLFQPKGLDTVNDVPDQYYIDKGKEIVDAG